MADAVWSLLLWRRGNHLGLWRGFDLRRGNCRPRGAHRLSRDGRCGFRRCLLCGGFGGHDGRHGIRIRDHRQISRLCLCKSRLRVADVLTAAADAGDPVHQTARAGADKDAAPAVDILASIETAGRKFGRNAGIRTRHRRRGSKAGRCKNDSGYDCAFKTHLCPHTMCRGTLHESATRVKNRGLFCAEHPVARIP